MQKLLVSVFVYVGVLFWLSRHTSFDEGERSRGNNSHKRNKKTFARKYEIDVDRYFGDEFDSDFEADDGSPLAAKSTTAYSVVNLMSAGVVGAAHARK